MSSPLLPPTAIPKPLADDDDDVSWALQTAAVQWGRGAYQDALVWLRRAAESAIELNAWSRGADLNAAATRLDKLVEQALSIPGGAASRGPSARPQNGVSAAASPARTPAPAPPLPIAAKRPVTTGYSQRPEYQTSDSYGPPQSSVIIEEVQEAELELSDEELRELEDETVAMDVPDGHRPSLSVPEQRGQRSEHPALRASALPAFPLEPSRSRSEIPGRPSALPPNDTRDGRSRDALQMPAASTSSRPPMPAGLPAFPMGMAAGAASARPTYPQPPSFPPIANAPRLGVLATSKPFAYDEDDSIPGIDEALTHRLDSELPPAPEPRYAPAVEPAVTLPPVSDAELVLDDEIEEIEEIVEHEEVVETQLDETGAHETTEVGEPPPPSVPVEPAAPVHELPRVQPSSTPAADVRATPSQPTARPSPRPLPSSLPKLPARLPRVGQVSERPTATAETPEPQRSIRPIVEPRMPERRRHSAAATLTSSAVSTSSATDDHAKQASEISSSASASEPPTVGTRSVAPPSVRGLEPQDLPTVSGPHVSSNYPEAIRDTSSQIPVAESLPEFVSYDAAPIEPLPAAPHIEAPVQAQVPSTAPSVGEFAESLLGAELEAELGAGAPFVAASGAYDTSSNEEAPLTQLPEVTSSGSSRDESLPNVTLMGVSLAHVRGFSEISESGLQLLATKAKIEHLDSGEESSFFSVALVLEGWVSLMPAIADCACATAVVGEVVYTEGTLENGLMLRIVAGQDKVVVATWDADVIREATAECPWIVDELKLLADGFQALAGACLGPLGDRLDDSLRSIVTSRCEIRTLLPFETLCAANKPVPGMHIIGGGEIELVDANGRVTKTHGSGEFLYAAQVLGGGVAPIQSRAGSHGALVLFAPRMAAHELLVSVPPLLELLAE